MNISALALYLLGALLVDEVVQPEHSNPRREGPVLLLLVTTKEAVDALAPLGQLILIVLARVVPGPAVSARDCACCAAERVLDAKRPIVVDSADLRRPKSRGHARGVQFAFEHTHNLTFTGRRQVLRRRRHCQCLVSLSP